MWARQFSADELQHTDFPDPQLFIFQIAKDNLMLRLNKKDLKITRKADRYDPRIGEFTANYMWWLHHPDFVCLVAVFCPGYEAEYEKRGIVLLEAEPEMMQVSLPRLLLACRGCYWRAACCRCAAAACRRCC